MAGGAVEGATGLEGGARPEAFAVSLAAQALRHRGERGYGRFVSDPVGFICGPLREELWSKQREIAEAVRDHRHVAVRSAHDTGKSFIASRLAAWWLAAHPPGEAFVVTTAPTFAQVRAILWREIHRAHQRGKLPGRVNQTEWWIDGEIVAYGRGMMRPPREHLKLSVAGRILEHLGIQMYQSPTAAVAELVANSWDADAEVVDISLPGEIDDDSVVVVSDDGNGMTFDECEERFLHVGGGRRVADVDERSSRFDRLILGRKGIGKFAGFGIARSIRVETTSIESGERTLFELNFEDLRADQYLHDVSISVLEYEKDAALRDSHGTTVTLSGLTLSRAIAAERFRVSMARRFLLLEWAQGFKVTVNSESLPEALPSDLAEYSFPADYTDEERPGGISVDADGWGTETVGGQEIRWRATFLKDTIKDDDLRGWSVFAGVKLAQSPFFFDLTGGAWGQGGQQYFTGQIRASFIDHLQEDVIATERQRIQWDHAAVAPLATWGRERTRELLKAWGDRRAKVRTDMIRGRVEGFAARIANLGADASVVERAVTSVARVTALTDEQFQEIGTAILTAWEQGRLHDLISRMAEAPELGAEELVGLLAEAKVLAALSTAEAARTRLLAVRGIHERVVEKQIENSIRDAIADDPWILAPQWETFRRERSVRKLLQDCAESAGLTDEDWAGRIDLALSSGNQLLLVEFMRPGLTVDFDHVDRWERYVRTVRAELRPQTASDFSAEQVTGYLVADNLARNPALADKIISLKAERMVATDWNGLLADAVAGWEDLLRALVVQGDDDRLDPLLADLD